MGTRRRWRRTTFRTGTTAVVAARVPALDCTRWTNSLGHAPTCCCPDTIHSSPGGDQRRRSGHDRTQFEGVLHPAARRPGRGHQQGGLSVHPRRVGGRCGVVSAGGAALMAPVPLVSAFVFLEPADARAAAGRGRAGTPCRPGPTGSRAGRGGLSNEHVPNCPWHGSVHGGRGPGRSISECRPLGGVCRKTADR